MKKQHIILLLFLLSAMSAHAQEKYFYLNLDVNKPLTKWIGDVSPSGVRAGYRVFINPEFSAGLDVGWSTYDQYEPYKTIEGVAGAISTDYFRYIYSYSLAASGQYNFKMDNQERFFPYAGLGLGAVYNEYVLYYNVYQDSERSWGFLARPEAGLLVKFGSRRSVGAMAAIHYDFTTNKSEKFSNANFSAVGFQIGLMFMN